MLTIGAHPTVARVEIADLLPIVGVLVRCGHGGIERRVITVPRLRNRLKVERHASILTRTGSGSYGLSNSN